MPRSLYIIDGHAQIYRAYYAPFRNLTSPAGEPTRATYVFCSMLFKLIQSRKPDYLAMALDVKDSTACRREIYPDYKIQRDPPPEDLPPQADRIVSIVEAMGIPILRKDRFEADDVMATIADKYAGEDLDVYLVSRDKDLEQLINEHVFLFDPGKDQVIDRDFLLENKGYLPESVIELQTLTGDNVDNIPGVKGIGNKTAIKLLEKYGSAQAVLDNASELTPKQAENVRAFAGQMPVTRQLVTLVRNVNFEFNLEDAVYRGLDAQAVDPVFEELGFHKLRDQLQEFASAETKGNAEEKSQTTRTSTPDKLEYNLVDTEAELEKLAKKLENQDFFAVDTETTGLNPVAARLVGISMSWEPGVAWYIPVRAAMGRVVSVDAVVKYLKPILENPKIGKIGQNIKYDITVLRQVGIEVAGVAFDTMIASFVIDALRRSHGMDALAEDLLGHTMIPITDLIGKGKNQITIDQVPVEQVCEYACEDADITWRLAEVLRPQLESGSMQKLFEETEMPLVQVLAEMENNGISLDSALLAKMADELADRIFELKQEIHKAAGHEFNIDSPKQLGNVLFDEQMLPVVKKTKTSRSTDAETLETLARTTDHEIPPLMLEYREISKLKSTYLDTLPGMVCEKTNRLHAGFHQTGAVTGRLSSSDPNLQNIPVRTELGRRIRGAFIPQDDQHLLIVADYSQIELRVLAHFCRDEALMEAFRSGEDIHAAVAAQVNGVELDEVTSEQRSAAKAVNFGIIYGQTSFGLSKALNISRVEAQDFIDRYNARYPGIKAFIDQCVAETKEKGYAETMLGRRREIPELNSRNKQQVAQGVRLAVNTKVQGTAADLIKRAMIDIHQAIKENRLQLKMLVQVHDELVFESPADMADEYIELVREKMTGAIPLDVPVVVDIAKGKSWLEAK